MSEGNGAVELWGMRREINNEGVAELRPVGQASAVNLPAGWDVLRTWNNEAIVTKGLSIGVLRGGKVDECGERLPGEARCALPAGERLLVMCSEGAAYYDGERLEEATRDYPAASLCGVDDVELSVTVGARQLSQSYTGGTLAKRDADALTADMGDAYCRLCGEAAGQGVFLQPVLARYRLVDSCGRELFMSPPVLLMHSEGAQCCGSAALTSADRMVVDSYNLTAKSYHVELMLPAEDVAEVSRMEVLMTPLFHPYDEGMKGSAVLGRVSGASDDFVRVGLAGRQHGLGTVYRNNAARIIMNAIARIEQLEERVAVVERPFGGEARRIALNIAIEADPREDTRKIKRAMARAVKSRSHTATMLSRPHRLTAGCAATSSGAVAWGNVGCRRYCGYNPAIFASAVGDGAWRTLATVEFAPGKGVKRSDSGDGLSPQRLGPVLCYPAPDARRLTVISYHNGTNHKQTFELTGEASGRYAVYISPTMKPMELPACSPTVTVDIADDEGLSFESTVAYSSVEQPLDMIALSDTGSSVVAIAGRAGSDHSWDFGRSRFTLGCRSGVYSAGVSLATGATGLRSILSRGIERPDAMATGPDGEVYVVHDGIVLVPRSGAMRRISSDAAITALGYNDRQDELWGLRDDGNATIFCRRADWGSYNHTGAPAKGLAMGDNFRFTGYGAVYDPNEPADEACPIGLTLRGQFDGRYGMVKADRVQMAAQGSAIDLYIDINGQNVGGGRPFTLRSLELHGSLAGPIAAGMPRRPVRALEMKIEGRVSRDFTFHSISIDYERANSCNKTCR